MGGVGIVFSLATEQDNSYTGKKEIDFFGVPFEDRNMNWDKGLKRITLVLSIIGAIVAAGLFYYDAMQRLSLFEGLLADAQKQEFDEDESSSLIYHWNSRIPIAGINTALENDRLWWETFTGLELGEEPFWLNDPIVGESEEEQKARLNERLRKLELLKEQGWCTANGESLPLTTEEAWHFHHPRYIKSLESDVRQCWIDVYTATATGVFWGVCLVWALYAATRWGAWPLYKWISVGFQEDKQKDGQKTNT